MTKIIIDEHEIELLFNVKASMEIADICGGDIGNLGNKINELKGVEQIAFFAKIICALANGAISKRNSDIDYGFESGEKKPFFKLDYFMANMTFAEMDNYSVAMYSTIIGGSAFTVPDGVNMEEKDPVLQEIEEERAKKEGK